MNYLLEQDKKNNMLRNIKFNKAQISKIIHLGRSLGSWLSNLGKIALTNVDICLARDNLPGLVSNIPLIAINKFERKISGKRAATAGKVFALFISNI